MIKDAEAPSVKKDELAAVCVPVPFFTNAGFSFPTDSFVESPFIPFSSVDPLYGITSPL